VGTFEELVQQDGLFAQLVARQMERRRQKAEERGRGESKLQQAFDAPKANIFFCTGFVLLCKETRIFLIDKYANLLM
jgi:hypothetical protein